MSDIVTQLQAGARWPDRKMPSFIEDMLSDEDMEALIAWLTYKARH